MNDYQVSDWGVAKFPKKGGDNITAFGQILAIERRVVLFRDDCSEYLIDRKDFQFEKKPEPTIK